jgi:hypothetical protein
MTNVQEGRGCNIFRIASEDLHNELSSCDYTRRLSPLMCPEIFICLPSVEQTPNGPHHGHT